MPVIYLRLKRDWPFHILRHTELITNQSRASRLDCIVISHRVNGEDFVVVDEFAHYIHRTIGEAMCTWVQRPIRLEKSAPIELSAASICRSELHPCFV